MRGIKKLSVARLVRAKADGKPKVFSRREVESWSQEVRVVTVDFDFEAVWEGSQVCNIMGWLPPARAGGKGQIQGMQRLPLSSDAEEEQNNDQAAAQASESGSVAGPGKRESAL